MRPEQVHAFSWKRLLPVAVLATGMLVFFALGLDDYLSIEVLRQHRHALAALVADMPVVAVVLFAGVYAASTAFSLPGGAALTVTGGFLFGVWIGTAAAVIGASIGAIIVFLAARSAFADRLQARAGPTLRKMERGFRNNALSYLLVLRLIPLFPFFVVNVVPALLGVSFGTYVVGTFIGIIPGTFVYASLGAGLGSIVDATAEPSLKMAFTPEVITALLGLALISLLPVLYIARSLQSCTKLPKRAARRRAVDGLCQTHGTRLFAIMLQSVTVTAPRWFPAWGASTGAAWAASTPIPHCFIFWTRKKAVTYLSDRRASLRHKRNRRATSLLVCRGL